MQLCILLKESMKPVPPDIEITFDAGGVMVRQEDTGKIVCGDHVIITGPAESVKSYLTQFDTVWFGYGNMMLQQFKLLHMKDVEFKPDRIVSEELEEFEESQVIEL